MKLTAGHCRLCGSHNLRFIFLVKKYEIVRCLKCDLTQIADKPSDSELKEIYGKSYFFHEKYQFPTSLQRENRRRLLLVKRFLNSNHSKIIEVGCGRGEFLSLAKEEFDVAGFDLCEDAVALASENFDSIAQNIWCADVDQQELPVAHYDAVCLWDVIEHLWNFKAVCSKLLQSLKPGGYLFLSTPDIHSFTGRVFGRYWPFMTPPEHVNFFSDISLRFLFENDFRSHIVYSSAKGKWTNCGFALKKIEKILPGKNGYWFLKLLMNALPSRLSVYSPSSDVRYLVVRNPEKKVRL